MGTLVGHSFSIYLGMIGQDYLVIFNSKRCVICEKSQTIQKIIAVIFIPRPELNCWTSFFNSL